MFQKYLDKIKEEITKWKLFWSEKKDQHLTIMLVPHDHNKNSRIYISYRSIILFFIASMLIILLSVINILSHNFEEYEINELNMSNEDFDKESQKLKEEVLKLHDTVEFYDNKIQNLYSKLGGDGQKLIQKLPEANRNILEKYISTSPSIPKETYQLESDILQLETANKLMDEMIELIKKKNTIVKNTPSLWPVKGYILFPFGKYISPIYGREVKNNGIDIGSFPGASVIATAGGTVIDTGFIESAGYYVKIAHRYGWKTIYSNMDRIKVKKDQEVSKEDVIGYLGKIPGKKFYNLHYEVHVGTSPLNPASFLNQTQN